MDILEAIIETYGIIALMFLALKIIIIVLIIRVTCSYLAKRTAEETGKEIRKIIQEEKINGLYAKRPKIEQECYEEQEEP